MTPAHAVRKQLLLKRLFRTCFLHLNDFCFRLWQSAQRPFLLQTTWPSPEFRYVPRSNLSARAMARSPSIPREWLRPKRRSLSSSRSKCDKAPRPTRRDRVRDNNEHRSDVAIDLSSAESLP